MGVREVLIFMSQIVIKGFCVWVFPIIARISMPVYIFKATLIIIIDWMMYFLKDFVVCQFHFLLVISTIFSIKLMIKLRMDLVLEDEVMLFFFLFKIFEFLCWY